MSRGHDSQIKERCPSCKLTDIYRSRVTLRYRCKNCGEEFLKPFIGRKTDVVQPSLSRSGVIAGHRTLEWKPLKRDFWELRDLATLTRKTG